MTKSLVIDPKELRKKGSIKFKDIDVCAYSKTIEEEKKIFTKADFMRIFRDMAIIREFENMLNAVKTTGQYDSVEHAYPGPAHLSMGQEASVVGEAYTLGIDDFIFGSHRSHGEILAKGLSSIEKLSDKELMDIMEGYLNGKILKIVQQDQKTVKELAIDFLIYGTLAEIFSRETGF
ncbi:MAG: thiamine pyrophosphate-dependent enzyme, partial [Clostridia bacterium]